MIFFFLFVEISALSWVDWKIKFNKTYISKAEESLRKFVYEENLENIAQHNELFENGVVSYKMSPNKFSDMTPSERQNFLNYGKFLVS